MTKPALLVFALFNIALILWMAVNSWKMYAENKRLKKEIYFAMQKLELIAKSLESKDVCYNVLLDAHIELLQERQEVDPEC